jgi:hypothetical protein
MKRFVMLIGSLFVFASPLYFAQDASAVGKFSKEFKTTFSDRDEDADWYKTVAKAGCNVCHIKKHPDKKKARNEYGRAIHQFLGSAGFPDSPREIEGLFRSDPEKASKMLQEVFAKANELESSDGKKFGAKIEAKELPATDWEYEEE